MEERSGPGLNGTAGSEARPNRARIVILATGGTIAGASDHASESRRYQAGALRVETLLAAVPALSAVADVDAEQYASIDSKDAGAAFWCGLSERINVLLDRHDVDGIVVTHGTDTLEETAYWLHLCVASPKPVVMTAAMRPATALSADGPANLFDAVTLAASAKARGLGVMVAIANRIHSARDIVKASSHAVDAFASPGMGPMGWVQDGQVVITRHPLRRHTVNSEFSKIRWALRDESRGSSASHGSNISPAHVAVVVSHAGVTDHAVRAFIDVPVAGIVVAGTGNGSIHAELLPALSRAAAGGIAVVRSSRVADVQVAEGGALDDFAFGFIASGTLNPYKARVLLMLALSAAREAFTPEPKSEPAPESRTAVAGADELRRLFAQY